MNIKTSFLVVLLASLLAAPLLLRFAYVDSESVPDGRSEVVFWHFWGGEDRAVVEDVVKRFNDSQTEYFVRAIAMPGNNLQAKLFLAVAGGDPPDLVNQDDPVLSDWGKRGVIHAIDEIAPTGEAAKVREWMLESAERLSVYDDRLFGVCNGLDIRALYYNKTSLDQHGLSPPETIEDLDKIAFEIAPPGSIPLERAGYIPDSRRLWAWGYVFGADFYDQESGSAIANEPAVQLALNWMKKYADSYGADNLVAFRKGDQSLPGKTFPLLPITDEDMVGRYTMIMDGQWRVRNLLAFQKRRAEQGLPCPEFGVCSLPIPAGPSSRKNAGWVNGNFFVVPNGAKNSQGAWEFAKFWIGYTKPNEAAKTCASGGWIPVSRSVTQSSEFKDYLQQNPLFAKFVELAESPNQFPVPPVVGAALFRRTVEGAAYEAMTHPDRDVGEILQQANREIQAHLERAK